MEPVSCAPLGYLEVLDKTGRVSHRTPVRAHPLRIGRAFDNDVIVDDPYVCPHHAQLIVEQGQPQLADLQSVNGITDAAGRPLPGTVSLAGGQVVQLGSTPFRYRALGHPLAPTLVTARHTPLRLLHKPLLTVAVFLLTLGVILLEAYIGSTGEFEPLKQTPILLGFLILLVVWSMLWSFASRLTTHRWNFWSLFSIACLGLLLSSLADIGSEYLCFALDQDRALSGISYVSQFLLIGAVTYLNLRLISAASGTVLARFAGGIALGLVLLTWGVKYSQQEKFNSGPEYQVTLKPPAWKLAGSRTTAEFFRQGEALFRELKQAQKQTGD